MRAKSRFVGDAEQIVAFCKRANGAAFAVGEAAFGALHETATPGCQARSRQWSRKSPVRQEEQRRRASGRGRVPGRTGPNHQATRDRTRRGWSPDFEHGCSSPVRSGACGRLDRYTPRSQPSRETPVLRLRCTCLGSSALASAWPTLSLLMSPTLIKPSSRLSAWRRPA